MRSHQHFFSFYAAAFSFSFVLLKLRISQAGLEKSWSRGSSQRVCDCEHDKVMFVYNQYPSPSVYQLRKSWGGIKPEPQASVLCRRFFQLINARARALLCLWYSRTLCLWVMTFCAVVFLSRLCFASEDSSEVYWNSGLQALFVTVFQTSVDFLCKTSYKSSSLLGYFDCFQSNHIVGCCNINFSDLSQIRREKICFASNVSTFLLYFFARLQLFRCNVWPTFHPATP